MLKATTKLFASAAVALALGTVSAAADIKVGVLVPDSGPAGLFGPSTRNSATLAAEQINAAGGINGEAIELVFADVGVPPAEAAQAALRLWKGEGAQAFVGMHDSAVREALIGRFNGQVPYVYTPVYEGNSCAPGLYVTGETPSQQLAPVIPYLAEKEGASKWYLIGHDYNWPRDTNALAKNYIAEAGGEVVGEEYVPFTVSEFDSSLQRIKESGADAILITLVGGGSVGFNVSFAGFGLDEQALRLGTLIEENTLAGIGAENADRLFSSSGYFASIDSDAAVSFAADYTAAFGADAPALNGLGQSAYEGLMLLAALANKAGSLDVAAMDAAAEGTTWSTPRGENTLTGRHMAQTIYLADGSGGTFDIVASFDKVASSEACAD
ncbi:substrate-binding domain-containing protein [Phaeobacter gallaeciensis]|jgi:ABC-type branched-subunit amino acid transport system substrate-binding protein|uniref:substrate-binding domain-containing protein n=1 Tax=Phaeobacter gallaeciensis TaxID=60890 RepID=UPI00237F68F9|nr:substrate-binding domain-containing protein [Phaeobacter gallaeciensis]MDE4303668.1 substrate-binding domain-containing protein [Phaeobacter gallaeciensis]MDE4307851.1 substrate-binding domain-containing protein [Phaeobacter gallaeciensis]MDE4312309.1 substrate-binding domain-containing protein [Phaeobacter gallaeciensis]MDE4316780.1 substrate-binding domain-containing protein [Phaeobacter gallaeciensis]MDE4321243.1 substrate-binding domain-containing protein [Phaeobacter gallaeciensis]